jgi:SAM-dependent methyltransferase
VLRAGATRRGGCPAGTPSAGGTLTMTLAAAVPVLLERLLDVRSPRTAAAYAIDLNDFARWYGCARDEAVYRLLAGGGESAREVALRYVGYLRRQGRAPATISRRLGTLRTVVRWAEDQDLIDWWLDVHDWRAMSGDVGEGVAEDVAYVLPRDPAEMTRLDLQHYALAEALGGQYFAWVRNPRTVLDVGAGTGQWGFDVSDLHREALVVGFDLVRPKPGAPATYRAVRGNVLQGLPFRRDSFDFVHQRFLFSGVPVTDWPDEVAELVRVCRGGGWVELVEGATLLERPGPATRRLVDLLLEVNRRAGLDTQSAVFRGLHLYLHDAGVTDVERRAVELPIGEWAGRVGSLMASDFRALFTRMSPTFTAELGVPAAECIELVRAARMEWEEFHTMYPVAAAWGQKLSDEQLCSSGRS